MTPELGFLQRLLLAFIAFFAVLFDRRFAAGVHALRERERAALPPGAGATEAPDPLQQPRHEPVAAPPPAPVTPAPRAAPPAPAPVPAAPAREPAVPHADALHLLGVLQRDGRLVDFLSEELTGFSDAEIGAAARTVHAGCKQAIWGYLDLEPIVREPEGATSSVPAGFDPGTIRLTGNVTGQPPFRGVVRHHGWRAVNVRLPTAPPGLDPRVLAPAEVEL